ncbi:MOSC domain-containing protein [Photobacterium sp. CCB-ST2H9]|uniref:MOSC domain-containing protein n=1 Tax=unclassified Photobacterium TaxID=2628852 RepID=UPI002006AA4E|nr:MOSC domain-containing protein [Photobacterium sp. CCB-ST2H9]UTM60079.1 MOSC domain-containing protein [Photobacterium sp. CCB-ST2H9]
MKLIGIARRKASRAAMEELEQINVSQENGVKGDFRGKPGKRQVTVLSLDSWLDACKEVGERLPWTIRRANLLVEGTRFSEANVGDVITIGTLRLQITRETDPCPRMDEQFQGMTQALMPEWRGGVCCRVLSAGDIKLGDDVLVEASGS